MFGLMFLAALLANIVFLLVVCGIGYFIYKKNENTIKEIESNLNTVIGVANTIINKVENIIEELKDKLNKFPF